MLRGRLRNLRQDNIEHTPGTARSTGCCAVACATSALRGAQGRAWRGGASRLRHVVVDGGDQRDVPVESDPNAAASRAPHAGATTRHATGRCAWREASVQHAAWPRPRSVAQRGPPRVQQARPVPVAGLPPVRLRRLTGCSRDGWTRRSRASATQRSPLSRCVSRARRGRAARCAAAFGQACVCASVGGARSAGLPGAIKYDGALDCLRKTLRASTVRFPHESATGFRA